jgi:glycosyltransferase involved in cell wall biosynthesis
LLSYLNSRDTDIRVEDWSTPLIMRDGWSTESALPASQQARSPKADARNADEPRPSPAIGRKMRCLIATSVLDAGGIDEFVAFLARRLPSQEIETTVMVTEAQTSGGRLMDTLRGEGIPIVHDSVEGCRRWLNANRPDAISAHAPPDWLINAADQLRIPVVETLHAVPTPIGTNWQTEIPRSRHVRVFIAVSDLVRRQYLRGNPAFDAEAIITIPNGFNDAHRAAVDRTQARRWLGLEDEFLFVSLARHVMQKNAYGLISAFSEVAETHPEAHLLIAGRMDDPAYMGQLLRLRQQLPARNNIHLRDNLTNPAILLHASDCFVLNSFFEGWPLASMEALCAGLPVIMSDVGGAREQVGCSGRFGHIVPNPAQDPETITWESAARERFRPQRNRAELASAMRAVLENREHWAAVRPELAVEASSRFDVQACAVRYAQVLRRVAGQPT